MTKVTINDTEYESEDFNKDQNDILRELQNNQSVLANVQWQLHSLNVLKDLLTEKLKRSLDANEKVETNND
jgi:hypothetical protein|tara:strand:- start:260 stop:472 length:213 start_codon:yes stop_codon:yes gene_type:complete